MRNKITNIDTVFKKMDKGEPLWLCLPSHMWSNTMSASNIGLLLERGLIRGTTHDDREQLKEKKK